MTEHLAPLTDDLYDLLEELEEEELEAAADRFDDYATDQVQMVVDALAALGYEGVVITADGTEPCASLNLGDGAWLDITAEVRRP